MLEVPLNELTGALAEDRKGGLLKVFVSKLHPPPFGTISDVPHSTGGS
ncbi:MULTISPECIES: hypothetical protein [Peribacillus]|nr:hypothetical protein [Peribacillus sp. TH24]MBK5441818.1 hypothetical protein [Peribacillus sp. TH24]